MTDQELKLGLAKILPEKLKIYSNQSSKLSTVFWITCASYPESVKDTEWLHVCHLIEQTLSRGPESFQQGGWSKYKIVLGAVCNSYDGNFVSATWQQRAEALIKTKGIKP